MKITYTHKGWFFLCPVYLNPGEGEGMNVAARRPWLDWWFDVNQEIFEALAAHSYEEQSFPFKVTGRLDPPVTLESSAEE
ncbi:hypothetical protein ACVC7V_21455 [Hydrogenophaga sp. A37]|uniref:hypothetical protein n=1 Tax=Hydrogenophaga sp. A37 TaxID=1945864 RepID=UPI00117A20BD|nr:hypothetical protein [Hydrogenophaga sp. A37]